MDNTNNLLNPKPRRVKPNKSDHNITSSDVPLVTSTDNNPMIPPGNITPIPMIGRKPKLFKNINQVLEARLSSAIELLELSDVKDNRYVIGALRHIEEAKKLLL